MSSLEGEARMAAAARGKTHQQRSETRDGMRIDWDVPIAMDDGLVLRADVFRPIKDGRYPVILSYGPYAKGLAFQDGYPSAWQRMAEKHPDVTAGSSNLYQSWEVVDPEKWVPHDYACVRVDSRGCGCSPGLIDHFSPRETKDFYDCIEWAGVQPWSNGKVGLNGISYYGINQWHVASLEPPHLAAMCIWEGAADWYRDMTHHGGILCTFWENWYDMQVKTVQYGAGERGKRSRVHGELVCGPECCRKRSLPKTAAISAATSSPIRSTTIITAPARRSGRRSRCRFCRRPIGAASRCIRAAISRALSARRRRTNGSKHTASSIGRISTPTTAATCNCASSIISCTARRMAGTSSRRCSCRFATSTASSSAPRMNGRSSAPMDEVLSRSGGRRARRASRPRKNRCMRFEAMGDGVTFLTPPLTQETEITGPSALKLFVSSSTVGRRHLRRAARLLADLKEVVFQGAIDPHTPVGQGWLRASHRQLDKKLSKPYRPYHTHSKKQPLKPGEVVALDVEIWPTSIVVPAGHRIATDHPRQGLCLSRPERRAAVQFQE